MGLTVDIVDGGWQEPGASWDDFVRDHDLPGFWHGAPIHAYARTSTEGVYLARAELDGEVVAVGCFRGLLGTVRRRYRDLAATPRPVLLRCSVPVSFSSGFAFARGSDQREREWLLGALHAAVRRRFGPWCRGVLYENVEPSDGHLFAQRRLGIRKSPVALLNVVWKDLDGYLESLPRKRRRRFARLLVEVAEDESLVAADLASEIDPVEAVRLDQLTRVRHLPSRAPFAPLPAGYFAAALTTGRAGVFSFTDPGSRLLRFDLVFPTATTLVTTVTGGEQQATHDLYAALFLREIAYAIDHGTVTCEFGPGALNEKMRFGCVLEDRYAFLVAR